MRILHIAAYDKNIGDNAAIINLRRSWDRNYNDITWISYDVAEFWKRGVGIREIRVFFKMIQEETGIDAILIGGGGLLEFGGYENHATGWKLPFNEEILNIIQVPIIFHGVGVNIFRGGIDYNNKAKAAIQACIDKATSFSVRNDGSYDKLKKWIGLDVTNVKVVPDPGLVNYETIPRKNQIKSIGVQPAFNGSEGINRARFVVDANRKYLDKLFNGWKSFPHTTKDYKGFGTPIVEKNVLKSYVRLPNFDQYVNLYNEVDSIVAMRGHGQMITIGIGLPGIYLSTQDKVRDFSYENGFDDYNVDILEVDWRDKLEHKVNLFLNNDMDYINNWYELRDKKVSEWVKQDNEVIKGYINEVQNMPVRESF